ncbi:MAG: DIP1984 family protein [Veillonella sp.]|nr:DIP1984 family protein [Veillonella sp.]
MKLAEALQERADLNYKISDLELRLTQNSLVQEGEAPNENPEELFNLTNCKTIVEGRSITEIIAEKDSAALRLSAYRTLASSAGSINFRARGSEIKLIPTVNVKDIQKEADYIAKQVRLLDNLLQSANWTTELIES